ncbi:MAG: hypothetical protein HOP12_10040, partial [Candidatus Eisenbacteria bacterium]|nr:hypothetical protein [Candidatus Eisenbacteria bacterium]
TWWPPHALAGIGAALRDSFALTAFVTVTAIAAAWAAERVLRGEHSEPAEAAERLEPRRLLWLGIAFVFIGMLPVGAVSELRRGYFFVIAALGASLLGGFVLARLPRGTSVAAIGALALSHWGANGFYEPQAEALGLARHAHAGYSFFRDNGQLTMRLMHSLEPACAGLVALPRTFALNVPTDVTLTTVMGPGARVACRDTSIHVQPIELMTPEDAAGSFGLLRFDAASERFLFEPVQPATRARLAEGLLFAGRPEVAAAGFVAAAQEMPGEPEIQYPMALALAAAGRAAEARSAWNEAKRLGFTPPPEQLLARLLYGLPTARADSLRARLEPAMRAAWSDAADSTAHRRLGRALIEVGLTRQASFELAAAAGLTHANEDLAWLGLAYERQGDVDRARVVYAQALRDGLREPTYGVARAGLSRVGVTAPPDVPRSSGRFGRFDRPTGR